MSTEFGVRHITIPMVADRIIDSWRLMPTGARAALKDFSVTDKSNGRCEEKRSMSVTLCRSASWPELVVFARTMLSLSLIAKQEIGYPSYTNNDLVIITSMPKPIVHCMGPQGTTRRVAIAGQDLIAVIRPGSCSIDGVVDALRYVFIATIGKSKVFRGHEILAVPKRRVGENRLHLTIEDWSRKMIGSALHGLQDASPLSVS